MSEPKPLHPYSPPVVRPLRDTLAQQVSHEVLSPWTPRRIEDPPPAPSVSVDAIVEEARARGRAEGAAETAELRTRLAAMVTKLEIACAEVSALASTQIAEAVTTVISTWTQREDRSVLLAPIIRAWASAGAAGEGATLHANPADVAAIEELLEGALIPVLADPTLPSGDLAIRASALELVHRWDDRLRELRERVIAALEHEATA